MYREKWQFIFQQLYPTVIFSYNNFISANLLFVVTGWWILHVTSFFDWFPFPIDISFQWGYFSISLSSVCKSKIGIVCRTRQGRSFRRSDPTDAGQKRADSQATNGDRSWQTSICLNYILLSVIVILIDLLCIWNNYYNHDTIIIIT